MKGVVRDRPKRGIPLRTVIPNAITALALCTGLTGVRFAIAENWEAALWCIVAAAVLDGMDGRVARRLNGQSRFGAELDSLSDVIAFGVSPAIIVHLWILQAVPRFGWIFALAYAVCAALRLARFNANIDADEQPHKSAGFLTGVPAPAGAGLLLLPLYLWIASNGELGWLRQFAVMAPWAALIAFLMISNVATFSWGSLRLRSHIRLGAIVVIALLGAALISAPWETLSIAAIFYAALIPFSMAAYAKVRRQRAIAAGPSERMPDANAPSL